MSTLKDIIKNLNKNNFQIIKRLGIDPKYKYVTVRIGAEESDNFVSVKCYSFKLYEGNFRWEWVLNEKVITFKIVDHKKDMYDFRGVVGVVDESHPQYGLYRFKKGFNAEFTEFVGELYINYKPLRYKLYKFSEKMYKRLAGIKNMIKGRG